MWLFKGLTNTVVSAILLGILFIGILLGACAIFALWLSGLLPSPWGYVLAAAVFVVILLLVKKACDKARARKQ